jgi:hypothetical protein
MRLSKEVSIPKLGAQLKLTRRGSLPQSSFKTGAGSVGAGTGALPMGTIMTGRPGPIPEG